MNKEFIHQFIKTNNITHVHISSSLENHKKMFNGIPNLFYGTFLDITLFWGVYRPEDYNLLINHKGLCFIFWHNKDCDISYESRLNNLIQIKDTLDPTKVTHIYNNLLCKQNLESVGISSINILDQSLNKIKSSITNFLTTNISTNKELISYSIEHNRNIITDKLNVFGKTVIVVGPAPYLEGKKLGSYIDSHDIVIRLNKGYNMTNNSEDFGTKTDILYHCVNQHEENGGEITTELIEKFNITNITFAYPILDGTEGTNFGYNGTLCDFISIIDRNLQNYINIVNESWYVKFEKELKSRPNTGIIAITDILNHNPKSLEIIGITFFKGGYTSLYRNSVDGVIENIEDQVLNRIKGVHNISSQKNYFNKNIKNDPRVIIDSTLKDILEENTS